MKLVLNKHAPFVYTRLDLLMGDLKYVAGIQYISDPFDLIQLDHFTEQRWCPRKLILKLKIAIVMHLNLSYLTFARNTA